MLDDFVAEWNKPVRAGSDNAQHSKSAQQVCSFDAVDSAVRFCVHIEVHQVLERWFHATSPCENGEEVWESAIVAIGLCVGG